MTTNNAMRVLLDDRLAPITSEMGFLERPLDETVDAYAAWQRGIHEPEGRSLHTRPVAGDLERTLSSLLPLVSVLRSRALFVPTASRWTAYFDNGWRGGDAFPPMSYLAERLGCRGLRVVAVADAMDRAPADKRSRYGALILEVYGPEPNPILNYLRTISLVNDDGWRFDQSDTPFPFEDVARYAQRRKRDRFTFAMLEDYCTKLGVRPFDEDFYSGPATLVELQGSMPPASRAYSLIEARAG